MKFMLGELFCGAGGITLGARECQYKDYAYESAWLTDNDPYALKTIEHNLPDLADKTILSDIRELDLNSLPPIDGLCFGFPCNSFSYMGHMRLFDDPLYGDLYKYGVQALHIHQPSFFLAENTRGIAIDQSFYQKFIRELSTAGRGYIVKPKLYDFSLYGVPQKRKRFMIVGTRKDLNIDFRHLEVDGLFQNFNRKTVNVKTTFENLPGDLPNNENVKHTPEFIKRISSLKQGDSIGLKDKPHLKSSIAVYDRRLIAEQPSWTITAARSHLYHPCHDRALTNREYARLQTFPDDYVFTGGTTRVKKQIGEAVPPLGAKIVLQQVLQSLVAAQINPLQY